MYTVCSNASFALNVYTAAMMSLRADKLLTYCKGFLPFLVGSLGFPQQPQLGVRMKLIPSEAVYKEVTFGAESEHCPPMHCPS
jgi:hypothetical protein